MAKSLDTKELNRWKDRIVISNRKFKAQAEDNIKKWRDYYRGHQWNDTVMGYNDRTVDNMVFSNIKTIMPSINFNNPRIYAQAKKKPYRVADGLFDTIAAGALYEILLNYYYKELEIKRQVDKALLDALIGPWGIIQIGYTLETEKIQDNKLLESNELIKGDSCFVVRRSPLDFRVDPEAKDSHLYDANWIAFRWVKSLEDVKSNSSYKNTKDLKSNVKAETDFHKKTEGGLKTSDNDSLKDASDWERVEGWDIWDKRSNKLITVVTSHDKELQNIDWPLDYDGGFPVEVLYFNENPDELFPISDVDIYMAAQDELNRLRSLHLDHVRRISQSKYITRENAFTSEELYKLKHGPSGTIAESKMAVSDSIVPLKDAGTSQDVYMAIRMLKEDIREGGRVSQFEKGIAQKFDTATEPNLIAQAIGIQREERSAILGDFIKHVVRKLGKVLQQTMGEKEINLSTEQFQQAQQYAPGKLEKIIGPDGMQVIMPWLTMSKEDIQGEYEFDIEIGSLQPVNKEIRKRDAIELYNLLSENPYVDPYEGTKEVLEAFERKDTERLLKDPQAVAQEQQASSEAALQAEIAKDAPKREVDMAKTTMKSKVTLLTAALKAGTEEKKAATQKKASSESK